MTAEKVPFGCTAGGAEVTEWRVRKPSGASFSALDYGAAIRTLTVPDRNGVMTDVVLGYDTAEEYGAATASSGPPSAGVGNRIGGGRCWTGRNTSWRPTTGATISTAEFAASTTYVEGGAHGKRRGLLAHVPGRGGGLPGRPAGESGLHADGGQRLHIVYEAAADADTAVNLTNHSYFNLAGGGSALGHELTVNAESFLENDKNCLPTGRLIPGGHALRFQKPEAQLDIDAADEKPAFGGGYDHCYVLASRRAAELRCPQNGIVMTVFTDMPGMQVYSANNPSARWVKGGAAADPGTPCAWETQLYPDGMAHYGFPRPCSVWGEAAERDRVRLRRH